MFSLTVHAQLRVPVNSIPRILLLLQVFRFLTEDIFRKRKNKHKKKFDLKQKRKLVIDEDFFRTYYQFLDNYQVKYIQLKSRLIEELSDRDENEDSPRHSDEK